MAGGYILLHRKMTEWGWYSDPVTKCLFLHLLLSASWKEFEFRGVKYPEGCVITTESELSDKLQFTRQKIRTATAHLEESGEIIKKSTNRFTVINIVKWRVYQQFDFDSQPSTNQQLTIKQPTEGSHIIKNKIKKIINKRESARVRAREAPTLEEIKAFVMENGLRISPERFFYYYSSKDWIGISDWRAKAQEWNLREPESMAAYDLDEFERRLNQPD